MDVLNLLLSYVLLYGYLGLFLIIYPSAVILPLPVNILLLATGAFASQGYLNLWLCFAVAITANVLGDSTDYFITRKYGEPVIRFLHLNKLKFFKNLEEELRRDAATTVFLTRFAGSLSNVGSFLAGMVGVPFKTFVWYDFLGNGIELFAALGLGYLAGSYWTNFSGLVSVVAGIIGVTAIMFVLIRMYRGMLKRYSA